ncbi:MAG: TRAP transporter small permease [Deltaproteobacteria bacterium]|nr:TRAP transporter small permease [Deltaproteobacteria bacterium]
MTTIYRNVCKTESFLARVTLISMVLLIFFAGIARVVKHPMNWAMDMSTFLFAWSCFLSADVAWREKKLMSIDLFVNLFPEKVRRVFKVFNYSVLIGFLIYLVFFGLWLSYTTRARAFQGIPSISYTWVTLSVPVGSILLFVTTILRIKTGIKRKSKSVLHQEGPGESW